MLKLIFITRYFPFDSGEEFVENEFPFFDTFDLIEIVTSLPINKNPIIRNTSDKTKLTKLNGINFFNFIFAISNFSVLFKEFKLNRYKIKKCFVALKYFLRGAYIYSYIDFSKYHKDDNVLVYSFWLDQGAFAGSLIEKRIKKNCNNVRVISRAHGFDFDERRHPYKYLPFRKYLYDRLDAIYPACETSTKYILNQLGLTYSDKIMTRYLGVNQQTKKNSSLEEIIILSCSNLIALKRVDLIAKALALNTKTLHWIHIGDGPEMDNIKKLEFPSNIKVSLIGRLSNEEVIEFYKNNEVTAFITLSSSEGGVPVSIQEAFSFGIPAIGTDIGGISEIINCDNGILLSENPTIEEINSAINLVCSKENHQRYSTNALKTWKERFDAKNNYESFISENINALTNK